MRGLVYKSIVGRERPAESVRKLFEALYRWADDSGVEPIQAWAGYNVGSSDTLVAPAEVRRQIEDGVVAIWMPAARSANTIHKIGGPPVWWDKFANPRSHTGPLPGDEARKYGHYLLDEPELFAMLDEALLGEHAAVRVPAGFLRPEQGHQILRSWQTATMRGDDAVRSALRGPRLAGA